MKGRMKFVFVVFVFASVLGFIIAINLRANEKETFIEKALNRREISMRQKKIC
jgi:hypothetical protein